MAELFDELIPPAGNESAQQFATRAQSELNTSVARDNILAEDAALDRRMVAGPGRLANEGAEPSVVSGKVRISNGFFYAGPGVDDEDDSYFAGLRLKEISSEYGSLELLGEDAPPLNKPGGTWGYISWYGDVVWFDTRQTSDEQIAALQGRWLLGKVVTDGSGAASIDTSFTQSIPNMGAMQAMILALTTRVETLESLGGGGEGGAAYLSLIPYKPSPADSRASTVVLEEKFAAMESRIGSVEGSNTRPQQTRTDQLINRIALLEQAIARLEREEARRFESAHVVLSEDGTVYGTGEDGDENFVGPGLQPNEDGKFVP
jgi:hypothetical protein